MKKIFALVILLNGLLAQAQQNAAISFTSISNKTYGGPAFNLNATSNNNETPIIFQSSNTNIVTVSNSTGSWLATMVGTGQVTITASQEGNANYLPSSATRTFNVLKRITVISFDLTPKSTQSPPFNLVATSNNLAPETPIAFESSNMAVATVSNSTGSWLGTIVGTGSVTITAKQDASDTYQAGSISRSLTVNNPVQAVISFEPLEDRYVGDTESTFGDIGFDVSSNMGSKEDYPILMTSSDTSVLALDLDPAHENYSMRIKKAGTVIVTASQVGNDLYLTPANVSQTLVVHPRRTDSLYIMNQDTIVQQAKLRISGKATVGKLTIKDSLNAASLGTHDILTRNAVTGEIEKISSDQLGGNTSDSTYISTTGSYTNPSWLSTLSWSKITDKPTTLSGLGITDAAPKTGSMFYIQNQFSEPQSASFYLNGEAIIGSDLNPTGAVNKPPFDLRSNISNGRLGAVLARLPEGNTMGDGTYLGIRGFNTQVINGVGQKGFSLEHSFYGYVNNSINFHRGGNYFGGFMTFNTNANEEKMRISSTGNLLINTTTDDNINKLQVNGSIKSLGTVETNLLTIKTVPVTSIGDFEVLTRNSVTGAIEKTSFVASSDPNTPGVINDANYVHISGNETITGTKTFNGLLGIGTLDPKAPLDIATPLNNYKLGAVLGRLNVGNEFIGIRGHTSDINSRSFSLEHEFFGQTNSSINFYKGDNVIGGFLTFSTYNNQERMRISSSGNVMIGTTTDDNANKLQVNGNIKSSGAIEGSQMILKATPAISTESFDILTRNTTTGVIEKTSGTSLIDQGLLVHTTGDETIAGSKTFTSNTTLNGGLTGTSASFNGLLTASNFSGTSSGINTGDQDLSNYMTLSGAAGMYQPLLAYPAANDASTVHNIGDEVISGLKTFNNNATFGGTLIGTSAIFNGTLTASNFSGTNSGNNTGDETQSSIISKLGFTPLNDNNAVHKTGNEAISGIKTFNGNIGIGTSDPGNYQLAVKGTIRTQAIKVDPSNWADYVFAKSYKLPALADVEKFINDKQHLPDIPSAAEVKKDGIELGDMNALLLKKIEELTLYMIEKDKEVKELKTRLDVLEKKK